MQKCKCKWCGDEFLGGPTRIRAHHVKPIVESGQTDRKYKICTSKANAALAFKAKCKEAIDERQLAKVKKTEQVEAEKKHTIVAAFVKESKTLAKKDIVAKFDDMNQQQLLTVTKKDLDDAWCKGFAAAGLPFQALRNFEIKEAMTLTIQSSHHALSSPAHVLTMFCVCRHGKALDYKGPGYNPMREEVLDRTCAELDEKVAKLCSVRQRLMSHFKSIMSCHVVLCCAVYCVVGTCFPVVPWGLHGSLGQGNLNFPLAPLGQGGDIAKIRWLPILHTRAVPI